MASKPWALRIWLCQSAGAAPLRGPREARQGWGNYASAASVSMSTLLPARAVRISEAVSGNSLAK
jgi:hypothetical protein